MLNVVPKVEIKVEDLKYNILTDFSEHKDIVEPPVKEIESGQENNLTQCRDKIDKQIKTKALPLRPLECPNCKKHYSKLYSCIYLSFY